MKAADRVKRAEEEFEAAEEKLRTFEDDNWETMKLYKEHVMRREVAREQLIIAVTETGIAGGGMNPVPTNKRTFDGNYLHYMLEEDKDLRDELVEVVYQVKSKKFDEAVRTGRLDKSVASRTITDIARGLQIKNKPKEINFLG